jgi:hypothetical protein
LTPNDSNMAEQYAICRGLDRLEQALKNAKGVHERRGILVRKACLVARLSRIDEARSILQTVAAQQRPFEPQMSAWILFCEGLIEHFESLGSQALGKYRRAHAVSISTGDNELTALSSAWIANAEFASGNFSAVSSPLAQAFAFADPTNSAALARSCLVVADVLNWTGQTVASRPWYKRARTHAVDEGDISMQSVLFYNDVAFRIGNLVVADCQSLPPQENLEFTNMSLDSSANLEMSLGRQHLTSMIPLLRAEVRSIEHRWEEAIALFDVYLADASVHPHARLGPRFLAQRAYCKAMLGDTADALRDVDETLASSSACSDVDDLFVLHSRVSQVLVRADQGERAKIHSESAQRCKEAFDQLRHEVCAMLAPLFDSIPAYTAPEEKNPA